MSTDYPNDKLPCGANFHTASEPLTPSNRAIFI